MPGLTAAAVTVAAQPLLGGAPARVILLRTLLLNAAAIVLALGHRAGGPIELAWGAAGLLGLCVLKLLVQDLPQGNAGSLVIAFLTMCVAILVVPRLLARRQRPGSQPHRAARGAPGPRRAGALSGGAAADQPRGKDRDGP